MRRQDHVIEFAQRRGKRIAISGRFRREDVDSRPRQMFRRQRVAQSRDIHYRTARGVNQQRTRLHQGNLFCAHHVFGGGVFRYVQTDHIAHIQQFRQVLHLSCITERQFIFNIIEIDMHPQRFRQNAQLRSDMAVTDNAKLFTARFERSRRQFIPYAAVRFGVRFRHAAQQQQ
ncbi:Uncharacterised protein [Salmonella enterica subsp. enterica serovar Bovismorbificans]|uniref:Uncharacterized protein n=2 Tax=Salmonella enterica subsp. enterica serovar Bovismorbificans TaxID=58097 RepID=A0A655E2T1_SALET|nr:Uncharacterised protein [Salmonella enterica subsp. enterica serovar Bovismorbificans]CNU11146.1 Uncharacterised protein [Salmonella enterica subsp. enterica serovar Bovismorbificans]CNU23783.1 Uncharacterised protein [Salmonella enterica subsp. enterica serovar Bovismorbificans]CNU25709.1 Uncharacterised protein [Salmonella enterica subsp. enterica serovar Bovismorbificans]CNU28366.1 Uncharacterised protein [Salmonella enterica subsp. enterica serovar Bovismorbificans]